LTLDAWEVCGLGLSGMRREVLALCKLVATWQMLLPDVKMIAELSPAAR
jgi:hypothetical protein